MNFVNNIDGGVDTQSLIKERTRNEVTTWLDRQYMQAVLDIHHKKLDYDY